MKHRGLLISFLVVGLLVGGFTAVFAQEMLAEKAQGAGFALVFVPGQGIRLATNVYADGEGVGIGNGSGVTNPESKLAVDIATSTDPIKAFSINVESFNNPDNAINSYFLQARDINAELSTVFLVRGDGHVGIRTADPQEPLTVHGNILSTANICDASGCLNTMVTAIEELQRENAQLKARITTLESLLQGQLK